MSGSAQTFSATVPDSSAGRRFDAVLAELFPDYSRSRLSAWIKSGDARLDRIDEEEMRELVLNAWAMCVPESVSEPFARRD